MQSAWAVLYCHLWPVWLYHIFQHYLINSTILGKKVIECKICVLIFSATLSETFLILRRFERDVITVHRSSTKVPFSLLRFKSNLYSLDTFSIHSQLSNLMKIRPVEAEFFHADGRTGGQTDRHDETYSRFSQCCEHT
jgi:hypothetical protein